MPYKDKDRQRQAVGEATRRYRAKGITKGITEQGITSQSGQCMVIPTCDQIVDVLHARVLANPKVKIEPQSYNPMMAGYVPPKETG